LKYTDKGIKLLISKMTDTGERDIPKTGKRFEPIACGTGKNSKEHVLMISKLIDKSGQGIPANVGSNWCQYMEMLIREQSNSVWVSPEELGVIFSADNVQKVNIGFKTN